MTERLKEELLRQYKRKHSITVGLCLLPFGIILTFACLGVAVSSILCFLEGQFFGGIAFLLVGVPGFGIFAYGLCWDFWIDYLKAIYIIKRNKYTQVLAECTSKTIVQKDHGDSDGPVCMCDYATLHFQKESKKYLMDDWGSFQQITPGTKYVLIFFGKTDRIDAVLDEWSQTVVYLR